MMQPSGSDPSMLEGIVPIVSGISLSTVRPPPVGNEMKLAAEKSWVGANDDEGDAEGKDEAARVGPADGDSDTSGDGGADGAALGCPSTVMVTVATAIEGNQKNGEVRGGT